MMSNGRIFCPLSLGARRHPQLTAISSGKEELSYQILEHTVLLTEKKMLGKGMQRGDRVAIQAKNSTTYLVVLLALWRIGAIPCPIHTRYPMQAVKGTVNRICCRWFIRDEYADDWQDPSTCLTTFLTIHSLIANGMDQRIEIAAPKYDSCLELNQEASILFSSGTTMMPKAVVHSVANHYYSALAANMNCKLLRGDRWLLVLPLFHIAGLAILWRCMLAGATIVLPDGDSALSDTLGNSQATHVSLVPTQLKNVLMHPKLLGSCISHLKAVLLGGATFPKPLLAQALELNLPMICCYGSTETASQITATDLDAKKESCFNTGKVLRYRQLRLGKDGEIFVKGRTLFLGYLDERGELQRRGKGWFATGDLGFLDENGYLHVQGRKDRMFISGGENIFPEEIEAVLHTLAAIDEATVHPVDDAEFGQRPVAFIKMRKGHSLDAKAILDRLGKILPRFKLPVAIHPWSEDNHSNTIETKSFY